MSHPDLQPSQPRAGECGVSDGFSSCTEPPGHGPVHWDRRTQHEWFDAGTPERHRDGGDRS